MDGDIEEIATYLKLSMELASLQRGFFYRRRPIEGLDLRSHRRLRLHAARYPNVDQIIGDCVASGKATLAETMTVFSLEDCYDVLEIVTINAHNRSAIEKAHAKARH